MLFIWNLDAGVIVQSSGTTAPLSAVTMMRSAGAPVELQFLRKGLPVVVADIEIGAVVKELPKFDGDSLIPDVTFTLNTDDATNPYYEGALNFVNPALNTLFFVDGNPANDVSPLNLGLAFGYSILGGEPVPSNNIALTVINNKYRGTESAPVPGSDAADYLALHGMLFLPAVVDYTGGGSTKLDGWQTTAGLSRPRNYFWDHPTEGRQNYKLRDGTDAESSPGIIRPDDFNISTNPCVYEKLG